MEYDRFDRSPTEPDEEGHEWPAVLLLRDTKLHDDLGGAGQRIYTTAGQGYKKVRYIRADLVEAQVMTLAEFKEHICMGCERCEWVSLNHPEWYAQRPRGPLKLDNAKQVFFYEQDHYYLSNFSAFKVHYRNRWFDTSEHCYHWMRFEGDPVHGINVRMAPSAHEAYKYAQKWKHEQLSDWEARKIDVMRDILREKARQHEYVRRKLLETEDRELIENSWRDPFWGWGENRDGLNMLGKLWMQIRAELRVQK